MAAARTPRTTKTAPARSVSRPAGSKKRGENARPAAKPAHAKPKAAAAGASAAGASSSARFLVHVVPGLEPVAAAEIAERIPGAEQTAERKNFDERTSLLEFRAPGSGGGDVRRWLTLGTAEDVFALAAQARGLRADREALNELAAATLTSRHLDGALRALAACRREPPRTFRVIARRSGEHAFRRVDAQRAVENALGTRLPRLKRVEDDADVEFWLTLIGDRALVAVRLSTARMRHGHPAATSVEASLKPTIARALVRLSRPRPGDVVLDPFCGAGTLLIERGRAGAFSLLRGGDKDAAAVARARANARAAGVALDVSEWDALALPLSPASVDVILTNPPFGKKVKIPGDPAAFYQAGVAEMRRVLRPGGRLVLVTSQTDAFVRAASQAVPGSPPLVVRDRLPILIRGERAALFVADVPAAAPSRPRG